MNEETLVIIVMLSLAATLAIASIAGLYTLWRDE